MTGTYTHTHSAVITPVGLNVPLSVHHIFGVKVRRSDVECQHADLNPTYPM